MSVLLDSVASQANRAELALLEGWELSELDFPVPYVDFSQDDEVGDIGKLTVLEAPHRLADAIFRDSLLGGTLFRLSEVGRAVTDAQPGMRQLFFVIRLPVFFSVCGTPLDPREGWVPSSSGPTCRRS